MMEFLGCMSFKWLCHLPQTFIINGIMGCNSDCNSLMYFHWRQNELILSSSSAVSKIGFENSKYQSQKSFHINSNVLRASISASGTCMSINYTIPLSAFAIEITSTGQLHLISYSQYQHRKIVILTYSFPFFVTFVCGSVPILLEKFELFQPCCMLS